MTLKLVFLKSDEDFNQFRKSKLFVSANLKLRVRFNTNQNLVRFGFIIPKKTLNLSVDRHKVKRRLVSVLQKNSDRLKDADYLFFPGKGILKLPYEKLEIEILKVLTHARVWKS